MTHIPWLTQAASQTGGGSVRVKEHAHGGENWGWNIDMWPECVVGRFPPN